MPRRECAAAGCRVLVESGRCPKHFKENAFTLRAKARVKDKWRDDNDPFRANYKTPRWKHLRMEVLCEFPICTKCHHAPSHVCDHVIPARIHAANDPEKFWERENLTGLCDPCHDSVKRSEERQQYNLSIRLSREQWLALP